MKQFLTLGWWKQFFTILEQKEKKIFFSFLFLGIFSFLVLAVNLYFENTKIVPAMGGTHIEGIIGSPNFINPVFAPASDVDRDITKLVFSGLMKYDENNQIVPGLIERYEILENGKVFDFYLRQGLLWSDNTPLTADDIIFTIRAIQNPVLNSPIMPMWLGIEVEKISELNVRFRLKNPSPFFLENAFLAIIPKHIWSVIPKENWTRVDHNLKPVGSGPYKIESFFQNQYGKIESLSLIANPNYFGKQPYIPKITFLFFENETVLLEAFEENKIKGFSIQTTGDQQYFEDDLKNRGFLTHRFLIPRYFALFFNSEKSKILERDNIRKALNYGTNRKEIIDNILPQKADIVISPILPEIFGFEQPKKVQEFNFEMAESLLIQEGFEKKENGIRQKITFHQPAFQFRRDIRLGDTGDNVRELQRCLANPLVGGPDIYPEGVISGYFGQNTRKAVIRFQERHRAEILIPDNLRAGTGRVGARTRVVLNRLCHEPRTETLPLQISLTTLDQPLLVKAAEQLKKQWARLGVKLEIKTLPFFELKQNIIRTRDYEALLFGQSLRIIPDPLPFWHSLQKRDPGLNLALFQNRRADELLEKIRQSLNKEERRVALEEFQNILIEENPALFLFNPFFTYFVSEEIQGISSGIIVDPSKRFNNIENWYIETKRIWK